MILYQFANGDRIEREKYTIISYFRGKRKVLSTSPLNGGVRTDLLSVFNSDFHAGKKKIPPLRAKTYAEHMALLATDLGLDPALSSGLGTAAHMDNVAICSETYADTTVTAMVTGGIQINGGRVGEAAHWHETEGEYVQCGFVPGTINTFLFISAHLTDAALVRSLITCTEAKVAALQELMASSCSSPGLATGSCTDGVIIVSDLESPVHLTEAGKHFKLGELIGKSVIAATKKALYLETSLSPEWQFSILERMGRFGVTAEVLFELCREHISSQTEFEHRLYHMKSEEHLVVYTSLYAHLLDQVQWGLIDPMLAVHTAHELFQHMNIKKAFLDETEYKMKKDGNAPVIEMFTHAYRLGLCDMILEKKE
ncbi:MAG: adenosylcobinamide amidohydrolase [Methanomicrobiales archaeon]|jgi:adenosylcobinamide amidohydrolase|nr:adenosylcobinamide amidohydrolase [Methanomicrobiales archaeon]